VDTGWRRCQPAPDRVLMRRTPLGGRNTAAVEDAAADDTNAGTRTIEMTAPTSRGGALRGRHSRGRSRPSAWYTYLQSAASGLAARYAGRPHRPVVTAFLPALARQRAAHPPRECRHHMLSRAAQCETRWSACHLLAVADRSDWRYGQRTPPSHLPLPPARRFRAADDSTQRPPTHRGAAAARLCLACSVPQSAGDRRCCSRRGHAAAGSPGCVGFPPIQESLIEMVGPQSSPASAAVDCLAPPPTNEAAARAYDERVRDEQLPALHEAARAG